jgi:hypothetical protein
MGSLFKEHLFSSLAADALEANTKADTSTVEKRIICLYDSTENVQGKSKEKEDEGKEKIVILAEYVSFYIFEVRGLRPF